MASKKRTVSFALTAIACCIVLFGFGIEFGVREGQHTSLTPNSGPLLDRIRVIAPKFGHAPVRAATVETCKSVLRKHADARALGCSEIIGVLISGEDYHLYPVLKAFPRTSKFLKKELKID